VRLRRRPSVSSGPKAREWKYKRREGLGFLQASRLLRAEFLSCYAKHAQMHLSLYYLDLYVDSFDGDELMLPPGNIVVSIRAWNGIDVPSSTLKDYTVDTTNLIRLRRRYPNLSLDLEDENSSVGRRT
jgi:hypothetical protein